jgi:hypothetical protein
MAQTSYSYKMQAAVPGGLRDTAPHEIVARANGETKSGAVKFGMGVVQGANPGEDVKLPTTASAMEAFEGVVTSDIKQMDTSGNVQIAPTDTLGVLKWGRVWIRIADGLTIAYGEPVYLIRTGDDAGLFSNSATGAIPVNAKFIGAADSGDIAPAEFWSAPATGNIVNSVVAGTNVTVDSTDPHNPVVSG